jgi:hypothetical protein
VPSSPSEIPKSQLYQAASPYGKLQIERFSAGVEKFGQAFEWLAHSTGEVPMRADTFSYHAASFRRFRVSDGPDLWTHGPVSFVPPASQSVAPGTSPQISGLFQIGGRVCGGPGEVGTGSSVSRPD